MSPMTKSSLF